MIGQLRETVLSGLWEIEVAARRDERGSLTRIFCADAFRQVRPDLQFVQANLSETRLRGTVRGLHFQMELAAECKLIRCLRGAVLDVAVDLRAESATFGRWHAVELSAQNARAIFIPEGFAHGFQSLSDDVQLLYHHTVAYSAKDEAGIRFDDPALDIEWPLPVTMISDRDRALPLLGALFAGMTR